MSLQTEKSELPIAVASISSAIEDLSLVSPKQKRCKDDLATQGFAKILDTSKKKLSSLDTQRVVAVLDDAVRRTEIVTLLPYILENIERYSVVLGSNLVEVIKEYDNLQNEYSRAASRVRRARPASSRSSTRTPAEDFDDDSIQALCDAEENMRLLGERLSNNIKTILRLFRSNPTAANSIKLERNERAFEANNLIDYMTFMREQLFGRLVTTTTEERDKQKTIMQILSREKKAQSQIKKLEEELSIATTERDKEIEAKNEILRNNKLAIQTVEQESEILNRQLVGDANKKETLELKNSEGRKGKVQQDLIKLKQQLQNNLADHRESELALRKRKFKMETEVENWIQKYDLEMTEKQETLDELTVIYNEESKQLQTIETKFAVLEKQYLAIVEERRIKKEKREQEEKELRAMIKAATMFQAFWRSYKVRKMLKQKGKKDKKKKKGKKSGR